MPCSSDRLLGAASGRQPSCCWKALRMSSGTFEVVFGQILLADAEISERSATVLSVVVVSAPFTGSVAFAHTS